MFKTGYVESFSILGCNRKCSIFKENLKCYFYFDISLTRWEARLPFMFNKLKESNNSVYSCCNPTFTWKLQQSNKYTVLNWQVDSQLSALSLSPPWLESGSLQGPRLIYIAIASCKELCNLKNKKNWFVCFQLKPWCVCGVIISTLEFGRALYILAGAHHFIL